MQARQYATFLTDVFREVRQGRLVPALFQRPYVWSARDVEEFWESVVQGVPIGTFLTWTPGPGTDLSSLGRGRIGPVPACPDQWSSVILDGQNRLASYAWSLRKADDPLPDAASMSAAELETWGSGKVLVADPVERRVRFVPREEADVGLRMPAGYLTDGPAANAWMRDLIRKGVDFPDAEVDWLFDTLDRKVRETRVLLVDVSEATPEEALSVFRRIARTGIPMSDQDYENALSFAFEGATAPTP